ncbi:hypothetical protein GCM10018962_70200 [Dactylosporangium matsuzakiense]|uniref:Uncharacterized protein n=1 Tax=Dactylosporangium matsuzakiense TaxID=53360 RepID=A0A9W6NLV8_9ACTN|nr:hypothetical protein GCM10017581_032390 [Dactylosporangium matsuzakiense]
MAAVFSAAAVSFFAGSATAVGAALAVGRLALSSMVSELSPQPAMAVAVIMPVTSNFTVRIPRTLGE